jgi:hypothetical protein
VGDVEECVKIRWEGDSSNYRRLVPNVVAKAFVAMHVRTPTAQALTKEMAVVHSLAEAATQPAGSLEQTSAATGTEGAAGVGLGVTFQPSSADPTPVDPMAIMHGIRDIVGAHAQLVSTMASTPIMLENALAVREASTALVVRSGTYCETAMTLHEGALGAMKEKAETELDKAAAELQAVKEKAATEQQVAEAELQVAEAELQATKDKAAAEQEKAAAELQAVKKQAAAEATLAKAAQRTSNLDEKAAQERADKATSELAQSKEMRTVAVKQAESLSALAIKRQEGALDAELLKAYDAAAATARLNVAQLEIELAKVAKETALAEKEQANAAKAKLLVDKERTMVAQEQAKTALMEAKAQALVQQQAARTAATGNKRPHAEVTTATPPVVQGVMATPVQIPVDKHAFDLAMLAWLKRVAGQMELPSWEANLDGQHASFLAFCGAANSPLYPLSAIDRVSPSGFSSRLGFKKVPGITRLRRYGAGREGSVRVFHREGLRRHFAIPEVERVDQPEPVE